MESAVQFLKAEQASFHSWHGVSFRSIFKPFQCISRGRENDDLIDRLKARNQSDTKLDASIGMKFLFSQRYLPGMYMDLSQQRIVYLFFHVKKNLAKKQVKQNM